MRETPRPCWNVGLICLLVLAAQLCGISPLSRNGCTTLVPAYVGSVWIPSNLSEGHRFVSHRSVKPCTKTPWMRWHKRLKWWAHSWLKYLAFLEAHLRGSGHQCFHLGSSPQTGSDPLRSPSDLQCCRTSLQTRHNFKCQRHTINHCHIRNYCGNFYGLQQLTGYSRDSYCWGCVSPTPSVTVKILSMNDWLPLRESLR